MKYLTTLYDLNNINNLSVTVDGFIIGNEKFGTRLTHSFTIDEISQSNVRR